MLFSAFEKHQYYNLKDLVDITKQPVVRTCSRGSGRRAAPVVGVRRGSCVNTLTCTCASVGFYLNTQKRVFDFHFSVSVDIPYGTRFRCAV